MTISSGSQALAADILKSHNADGYESYAAATTLTIATGAITVTKNYYLVDTEAAAATDDLDTITLGANVDDGHQLVLAPASGARSVVIKHNTGNILTIGGNGIVLDDAHDFVFLVYNATITKWMASIGFAGLPADAVQDGMIGIAQVLEPALADNAVSTSKIQASAVTSAKLAAAVAGNGLAGGAGTALSVNVDGTTIQITGDTLSAIGALPTNLVHRRQGGSASSWASGGTSPFTPASAIMQVGAIVTNGAGVAAITYPVAFSDFPLVFLSTVAAVTTLYASNETAAGFTVNAGGSTIGVYWMAIGPP